VCLPDVHICSADVYVGMECNQGFLLCQTTSKSAEPMKICKDDGFCHADIDLGDYCDRKFATCTTGNNSEALSPVCRDSPSSPPYCGADVLPGSSCDRAIDGLVVVACVADTGGSNPRCNAVGTCTSDVELSYACTTDGERPCIANNTGWRQVRRARPRRRALRIVRPVHAQAVGHGIHRHLHGAADGSDQDLPYHRQPGLHVRHDRCGDLH
jgi:hypothetical protein